MGRLSNSIYRKISIFFALSAFAAQSIFAATPEQTVYTAAPPSYSSNTITLDVKNIDIVDALKILADKGRLNLSISGSVKGRVTLFLKDIDVWDALEIAIASANLAYEKRGDIIYVLTARDYELKYGRKYWDERDLKVFNLRYAKVSKASILLSQVVSKVGKVIIDEPTNTLVVLDTPERIEQMASIIAKIDTPIETRVFTLDYLPVKDLEEKFAELVTKDVGSVKVDEITNKIALTDYPRRLDEIEKIMLAFDEKPLQVLIDAKIIEIRPSKKYYAGIDWDYWIRKYFEVQTGFPIPIPSGTTDKFSFGTIGVADPTQHGEFKAVMEFLEIFGETRVLSTPRILALNNQEAKILVGTKDVYITSSVAEIGDSAVTTQEVNFVDVGVKLYVTPTINKAGYVTLKIRPEVSSSVRELIRADDKETEIPIVTTSEAETSVIVRDGVSIIIGGLRRITRSKEKRRVPVLGSIPILGAFFRSEKDEWSKDELVILLTPRIISGDKSIEVELKEKMDLAVREARALQVIKQQEEGMRRAEEALEKELKSKVEVTEELPPVLVVEKVKEEPAPEQILPTYTKEADEEKLLEPSVSMNSLYYLEVVDKINEAMSELAEQKDPTFAAALKKEGRIKLRFVLSREGELLNTPEVIASDTNGELKKAVQDVIKKSSPFPPFPESQKKDKETFEILLVF